MHNEETGWFLLSDESVFYSRIRLSPEMIKVLGKFAEEVEEDEREKRPLR